MKLRRTRRAGRTTPRRGMILIETLCALLMGLFTGAALLAVIQITISVRSTTMGPSESDTETRRQLDEMCDKLRSAQPITVGSGLQVFSATASSSVTIYTDTSGSTTRFWLNTAVSPAALEQTTVVSGVSTTTVLLSGVTALQFTYYEQPSTLYTAPSATWTTTANPNAPVAAEMPKIGTVDVHITVSYNGYSRQLYSVVGCATIITNSETYASSTARSIGYVIATTIRAGIFCGYRRLAA